MRPLLSCWNIYINCYKFLLHNLTKYSLLWFERFQGIVDILLWFPLKNFVFINFTIQWLWWCITVWRLSSQIIIHGTTFQEDLFSIFGFRKVGDENIQNLLARIPNAFLLFYLPCQNDSWKFFDLMSSYVNHKAS